MDVFGFDRITISDWALREGIILDAVGHHDPDDWSDDPRALRRAAVAALARRSPVPVELEIDPPQEIPPQVEAASYYVISEALTNTAKYANAQTVRVSVHRNDAQLHVEVADDGRGSADRRLGSGLNGLADRVSALGGHLRVVSPAGVGTTVTADMPIAETLDADPSKATNGRHG
jgi:nitrate/nitrite-specific signal transduction histidine kinase